jgi:hypothetical protein
MSKILPFSVADPRAPLRSSYCTQLHGYVGVCRRSEVTELQD